MFITLKLEKASTHSICPSLGLEWLLEPAERKKKKKSSVFKSSDTFYKPEWSVKGYPTNGMRKWAVSVLSPQHQRWGLQCVKKLSLSVLFPPSFDGKRDCRLHCRHYNDSLVNLRVIFSLNSRLALADCLCFKISLSNFIKIKRSCVKFKLL